MDYQPVYTTSKPRSSLKSPRYASTASSTFSRPSESASIKYFSTLTNTEKPYISPYTQGDDLRIIRSSRSSRSSRPSGIPEASKHVNVLFFFTGQLSIQIPNVNAAHDSSQDEYFKDNEHGSKVQLLIRSLLLQADKEQMLRSLRTHRVNTLTELRRIEKLFASESSKDVTEAMTTAWAHYVNSNNLLSELRGMTKNYPFSSECLDEAKWQVIGDPRSARSWNYCWLILTKIKSESLIKKHARLLAAKPAMWGGKSPSAANIEKLANACIAEWTRALDGMLRQWSTPPSTSGR
ncbi:MAG: hypothetical protein Q9217_000244 [Psora testacea]